jgi:hypothetical protein
MKAIILAMKRVSDLKKDVDEDMNVEFGNSNDFILIMGKETCN